MAKKQIPKPTQSLEGPSKISQSINFKHRSFKLTEKQKSLLEVMVKDDTKVVFIAGSAGTSKAQPLSEPVLTPNGWINMGDVKVGDSVYSADGNVTIVTGVFPQGIKDVFKISFNDGSSTRCTEDHLWLTQTYKDRNFRSITGGKVEKIRTKILKLGTVKTTAEIADSLLTKDGKNNHYIPLVKPVDFPKKSHLIDPYILGILIGDGCLKYRSAFSSADNFIINEVSRLLPNGFEVKKTNNKYDYAIISPETQGNEIYQEVKRLGLNKLSYYKFIPDEYMFDSVENRISLLQGLMDSDGWTSKRQSDALFGTSSERLCEDFKNLVQSLGGIARSSLTEVNFFTYKGQKKKGAPSFKVNVSFDETITPFRLPRKVENYKPKTKYLPSRIVSSIEKVGQEECQCISVSNESRLYITKDYIVTHNTMMSVMAALTLLQKNKDSQILYVRSIAESAEKGLGSLPGEEEDKFGPFTAPLYDKVEELISAEHVVWLRKNNCILPKPINYVRGASWMDKIVIADECQNFSFKELTTLITRLGEGSRLFLCGDFMQADIKNTGFEPMFNLFDSPDSVDEGIHTFKFTTKDIVRSGILRFIVEKLEGHNKLRQNS